MMNVVKIREVKAAKQYSNWTMQNEEPNQYEKVMLKKEAARIAKDMQAGYMKMWTEFYQNNAE